MQSRDVETPGQGQPPPPRKLQPHQIAIWSIVFLIVASALSPYVFRSFQLPELLIRGLSYLMIPAQWIVGVLGISGDSQWIVAMLVGLLNLFLAIYVPVKLWMTSSKPLRKVLLACVTLYFLTYQAYSWYSTRIDWTAGGLNPDRPGFEPQVVVLAGEFDYTDKSLSQRKSGSGLFEIRMRGKDYYYCKKWHGRDWRVGSWYRVQIAVDGEGRSSNLRSLSHTTRGGGGTWLADDDAIVVARRLWDGSNFVGAAGQDLVAERRAWPHQLEEFSKLVKIGPWSIPTHIRFSEKDGPTENFYIRKIEFWHAPDTNWFELVMAKYRPNRTPELRTKDLDEPGITPSQKRRS